MKTDEHQRKPKENKRWGSPPRRVLRRFSPVFRGVHPNHPSFHPGRRSTLLFVCLSVCLSVCTVETYDKKFQFSVRESGNFLTLGCLYTRFWTRNPSFRSKLSNSGVQRSNSWKNEFVKIEGLDFLSYDFLSYVSTVTCEKLCQHIALF